MRDLGVENVITDTSVSAHTSIDCRGLTVKDQRRIIVHYTAEMVHQVLSAPNVNPLGVTTKTELVENPMQGYPRIRVTATAPICYDSIISAV
jgi:hypothetical protein